VLNLHFEFTVNEIAKDVLLLILGWSKQANSGRDTRDETEERMQGREREGEGDRKSGRREARL